MSGERGASGVRVAFGWLLAAGALSAAACASGGVEAYADTFWREDLGRVDQATLEAGFDKMVRKYALHVVRTDASNRELYYETAWHTRGVVATEAVRGVESARNRIVLRARPLEANLGGRRVYRVQWMVQNEVMSAANPDWHADAIPEMVIAQYRPIYSDLMLEVRAGVRR